MSDNPTILKAKGEFKKAQGQLRKAIGGDKLKAGEEQLEGEYMNQVAELRIQHSKKSRNINEEESVAKEEEAKERESKAVDSDYQDDEW